MPRRTLSFGRLGVFLPVILRKYYYAGKSNFTELGTGNASFFAIRADVIATNILFCIYITV